MRRLVVLAAVALSAAISLGLYQLKYEVIRLEDTRAGHERAIIAEHEAVRVLRAEWSYLNRPERLEALSRRHLDLVPVAVRQIGALDDLPLRAATATAGGFLNSVVPKPRPKPRSARRATDSRRAVR